MHRTFVTRYSIVQALRWPLRRNTSLARVLVNLARDEIGCPEQVQYAKVTVEGRRFVVAVVGHDREQKRQAERN